jgi:hypothetical protein
MLTLPCISDGDMDAFKRGQIMQLNAGIKVT